MFCLSAVLKELSVWLFNCIAEQFFIVRCYQNCCHLKKAKRSCQIALFNLKTATENLKPQEYPILFFYLQSWALRLYTSYSHRPKVYRI